MKETEVTIFFPIAQYIPEIELGLIQKQCAKMLDIWNKIVPGCSSSCRVRKTAITLHICC